jgi:hypothetical protein
VAAWDGRDLGMCWTRRRECVVLLVEDGRPTGSNDDVEGIPNPPDPSIRVSGGLRGEGAGRGSGWKMRSGGCVGGSSDDARRPVAKSALSSWANGELRG